MNYAWLLLSPSGRIRRRMYWRGMAIVFIAVSVVGHVAMRLQSELGAAAALLVWPLVCVTAKRLHDLGLSAWWQLLWWAAQLLAGGALIAAIATSANLALPFSDEAAAILPLATLATVAFYGWLGAVKGRGLPNRYGPWPGEPLGPAEVFE